MDCPAWCTVTHLGHGPQYRAHIGQTDQVDNISVRPIRHTWPAAPTENVVGVDDLYISAAEVNALASIVLKLDRPKLADTIRRAAYIALGTPARPKGGANG